MAETLITADTTVTLTGARAEGEDLWVPVAELAGAGWKLEPEGACKGDVCVPVPPGHEPQWLRPGAFNFVALARHLGQPVVHDAASATWVVGESAGSRNAAVASLEAPDFSLPDLSGRIHSLSDYRGRKVFLASWASW